MRSWTWQCCFWIEPYLIRWDQRILSIWHSWWVLHFIGAHLPWTGYLSIDLSICLVIKLTPISLCLAWKAMGSPAPHTPGSSSDTLCWEPRKWGRKAVNPESKCCVGATVGWRFSVICFVVPKCCEIKPGKQWERAIERAIEFFFFPLFGYNLKC